jgi:hypothetical protein
MERRPCAADDFAAIRARMEETKCKRERSHSAAWSRDEERLDERRWRISDQLKVKFGPRRNAST